VAQINSQSKPCCGEFQFVHVSEVQVKQALFSIKSQAVGCDGINIKLLTLISDYIVPPLTHIINTSLSTGVFPSLWKTAYVRPLAKVTSPADMNDYRPISILPALSKVAEKLVYTQLTLYLTTNGLLDRYQSGFRPRHSTATALTYIVDQLASDVDKGKVCLLSLLDFSKAFDSVNFDVLLAKLASLNVSLSVAAWFRSYLSDRSQIVLVNERSSSSVPVSSGVPQGSVLGPLLFSIYLSGISSCLQHCSYHLYADDLQIFLSSPVDDFVAAVDRMNQDLQAIKSWSAGHMLVLNPSKCQAMIVGFPNSVSRVLNNSPAVLKVSEQIIPYETKSLKNLGVLIDPSLTWDQQTTHLCKKVFRILHPLKRLKYILPTTVKAGLVQSLVFPVVDYCDMVFAGLSNKNSNRLQKVFNNCARFIIVQVVII
jgi:hypothetical protein